MSFARLPAEIIVHIASYLTEGDIARFLRVHSNVHSLLSDYLLKRNVRRGSMQALAWATISGRRSLAQRLIHHGADINRRLRIRHEHLLGSTLLHFATFEQCQPMVNLLLALGADPSLTDPQGRTAVYWAYQAGTEKVIHSITTKIIDLSIFLVHRDRRLTPLHMACSAGLIALVGEYIDMGLDVFAQDHHGKSALEHARSFLADRSQATTSDSDSAVQWTRMLVALGEDVATAHDRVSRHISGLPNHKYHQAGKYVQVGRRWCERTMVFSSTPDAVSSPFIPDVADFPAPSDAMDQAPPPSSTTQSVWSPASLARSVVKESPSMSASIFDPFPLLPNRSPGLPFNEPSVSAWTTFRTPAAQHDSVVEEVVPILKRAKRRWQPLKF